MQIRPDQLDIFQPQADTELVERIVAYLLDEHAEVGVELPGGSLSVEDIPPPTLSRMVRNGIDRARDYGMTWESSLTTFVGLMFVCAPNFDRHPLVRTVLTDESEPPDTRVELLWEQISEENWDAVEDTYDPEAWEVDLPND